MKKTALLVALLAVIAIPAFAQGPFTDVPTDHWAYDAVNTLQKDGVLIGYPDGTFNGKRTITRYEFAVALARLAQTIQPPVPGKEGITKEQLDQAIAGVEAKIPNVSNLATKADVDALRKLIDEFRDEIAALGVDVDALKRDVAALGARVDALEAEQKRVRFTGDVNVFAITTTDREGAPIDLDNRALVDKAMTNIGLVKDFDLKIQGRVSDKTTANATINYGNYLNYLGFVDDYIGGARPTTAAGFGSAVSNGNTAKNDLADTFFPYYLYIDTALGKGALTVGRFPIQFTPYTLKKIDVDSYTNILKADDGNYPMDGAKLAYNLGGVDLTLFAAKNDSNDYLKNGLTGQPAAGFGILHQAAIGNAVGGLDFATQTAGVRAGFGIPWGGTLGATFYQTWQNGGPAYDQARVYGADLALPLPWVNTLALSGSWTKCDTLATDGVAVADVDYQNIAWDGKLSATIFGNVAIGAGYKSIGRNFAAAGAWDKIGRWTNPVNVKGPYADFAIPILSNLKLNLNGEFLNLKDVTALGLPGAFGLTTDDTITKAEAALRWGISKTNALDASYQWVKFNPDTTGADEAIETYLTVGLAHQMSPNAGIKIGWQFVNYDNGSTASGPYGADYRGGLGVVQMGVSF